MYIYRHKQEIYRGLSGGLRTASIRKGLGNALAMALACASGLTWTQSAHAEDAVDGGKIGEIVVTARHTKEDVQKTPISIAVISGDALKKNGVTDITGLTTLSPDLNITMSEGAIVLTVRGISSRDTNENGDPAVSVGTDGFFVNHGFGIAASMYDIERIEVLRGPQGTLSGRNSVGGTLNIITAKPVDKFEAFTSVEYGNYNDLQLQGMVNVPLSSNLQARLAFLAASHDGYRKTGTTTDGDSQDDKSARLELAWQPTENLHLLLTGQYTSQTGSGDVLQYIPFIYKPNGALDHDMPAGINAKTFPLGTNPFMRIKDTQVRAQLVYDLGKVEMTMLGGYDDLSASRGVDQSIASASPPVYQWQPSFWPKTASGELRFASHSSSPFQWQFGGYVFSERSHLFAADAAPLNTGSGGWDYYFGFVYKTRSSSQAGYAHATYQLTPKLKLSGGLRYSHDYKTESGSFGNLSAGIVYGSTTVPAPYSSSSKLTYSAGLDYQLSPSNMLYAKIATGYKAGGFNVGATPYKPETARSIEIGSKNQFLDDTLQLNLAAYWIEDSDQQVSSFVTLPSGQSVAATLNAGRARIYGLEGDVIYKFLPSWTFNLNANWLHSRYTQFLAVPDPSDPVPNGNPYAVLPSGNVDMSGNTPPQAPAWSFTAGLEKEWATSLGRLTARIQTKAQASSYFSFYNLPDTRQKAYMMSDFFLTLASKDDRWKVTGFVRNLEDKVVFRDAEESQYTGAYGFEYMPPRTFGVRVDYNW